MLLQGDQVKLVHASTLEVRSYTHHTCANTLFQCSVIRYCLYFPVTIVHALLATACTQPVKCHRASLTRVYAVWYYAHACIANVNIIGSTGCFTWSCYSTYWLHFSRDKVHNALYTLHHPERLLMMANVQCVRSAALLRSAGSEGCSCRPYIVDFLLQMPVTSLTTVSVDNTVVFVMMILLLVSCCCSYCANRCGSTLVANMLASIPANIMWSESTGPWKALHTCRLCPVSSLSCTTFLHTYMQSVPCK
jgi:hypothetical protein